MEVKAAARVEASEGGEQEQNASSEEASSEEAISVEDSGSDLGLGDDEDEEVGGSRRFFSFSRRVHSFVSLLHDMLSHTDFSTCPILCVDQAIEASEGGEQGQNSSHLGQESGEFS